jgi:transposase
MNHVAIDLGGRESQICVRGADGTIIEEKRHTTQSLEKVMKQWPPSRVIVETSVEAFRIADAARSAGHEVRVVPATLVRTLGVGARGIKTDQRDARTLSEVSCRIDLPSVHIPTSASRELKSVCGAREEMVEVRTKLINNVRGWLRGQLWRICRGATETFHERVRAHAASLSVALPPHVTRNLIIIEVVTAQIRAADAQLRQVVKTDSTCQALMTVPGVGPVVAARFRAAIDDASRFTSSHGVQSYSGLTPGECSSSERQRRTGITKAGPSAPRRMLIQGAWIALRYYPNEPMVKWAMNIVERRGKFVGVVALARKIAGVMFALWRDGTTYQSERSAASGRTTGSATVR